MAQVETISCDGALLCMLIRQRPDPAGTTFYTPSDFNLQVGRVIYPAGSEIPRHCHLPMERRVRGTSEVLMVQKGRMILDVYRDDRTLVCSREMEEGDIVVSVSGGHGFRLLADTILLEVKQGPYSGVEEKERF